MVTQEEIDCAVQKNHSVLKDNETKLPRINSNVWRTECGILVITLLALNSFHFSKFLVRLSLNINGNFLKVWLHNRYVMLLHLFEKC